MYILWCLVLVSYEHVHRSLKEPSSCTTCPATLKFLISVARRGVAGWAWADGSILPLLKSYLWQAFLPTEEQDSALTRQRALSYLVALCSLEANYDATQEGPRGR